ncbi:MAG: diguanylate cyclase response regulator [Gammaproteobacteria bacterium RBG_16_57_12]|nr:MAG: diguanylate cyclase response regulator [Gammaproteobacteria bacterium RBG_16_57_12]
MNEDKPKILIVDDEGFNINLLNALLKTDYKIMVAASGEQALKGVATGKPDLILLDIMMPGMDGYEVLRRLKADAATQTIPVIFVTAMGDAADETRGFDLGAVDYITKPFNRSVVKARVRTHMHLKRKNDLLEKMASIDALTEIPNRRAFDEMREREWKRSRRAGLTISIAMLDVDMFKHYNDSYGHGAGDECLARVARALSNCLRRPADFVARCGGEEFAVILPETDNTGAMHVGELLRTAIAGLEIPHTHSRVAPHVTISVGIATAVPMSATTAEMLIEAADKMLYEAKKSGRNNVKGTQI